MARPVEVVALDAQQGAVATTSHSQSVDDLPALWSEGSTEGSLPGRPLGPRLPAEGLAFRGRKKEKHLFRHRDIVAGDPSSVVTVVTMG
jgi:hypothetical protein